MIEWIKPNGNTITTNASKLTIEGCVSMGFKRKGQVGKVAEAAKPIAAISTYDGLETTDDKQVMAAIVKGHNGKSLDLRGSVDKVRAKAYVLMEAY